MTELSEHPTWKILDSSKWTTFMDCPRRYFWEYVLGWRSDAPNNHLEFGTAWHDAMEYLLLNGYSDECVIGAFDKFLAHYRDHFPESSDELYDPKTPRNALKALSLYAERYLSDLRDFEVLYTEAAGTVPVNEVQVLHFRLDSICRDTQGRHFSLEHKTGSRLSRFWTDQWPLSPQVGTYTHVMHCLYPSNDVWGVKINGTFFQKTKIDFSRIPIRKTLSQMQQWLWNVNWWADQIAWQFESLTGHCSADDPVLMAFPQQPGVCTKYFGCPYHDFCLAWPNPLQHLDEIPAGFKYDFWDPSEREATHRMDLTK